MSRPKIRLIDCLEAAFLFVFICDRYLSVLMFSGMLEFFPSPLVFFIRGCSFIAIVISLSRIRLNAQNLFHLLLLIGIALLFNHQGIGLAMFGTILVAFRMSQVYLSGSNWGVFSLCMAGSSFLISFFALSYHLNNKSFLSFEYMLNSNYLGMAGFVVCLSFLLYRSDVGILFAFLAVLLFKTRAVILSLGMILPFKSPGFMKATIFFCCLILLSIFSDMSYPIDGLIYKWNSAGGDITSGRAKLWDAYIDELILLLPWSLFPEFMMTFVDNSTVQTTHVNPYTGVPLSPHNFYIHLCVRSGLLFFPVVFFFLVAPLFITTNRRAVTRMVYVALLVYMIFESNLLSTNIISLFFYFSYFNLVIINENKENQFAKHSRIKVKTDLRTV